MSLCGKIIPKNACNHRLYCFLAVIFIFISISANAQLRQRSSNDSLSIRPDTTLTVADSTSVDTLGNPPDSTVRSPKSLEERLGIRISKDAMDNVVVATARYSAVMNLDSNLFYIYGKAKVTY